MSKKLVICSKCGEGSTIAEWNKATDKSFPPAPGYEDAGATIDRLSKKDFDKHGFCVKDKPGSTEVTYYCCPKCHKEICSDNLKMIIEEVTNEK